MGSPLGQEGLGGSLGENVAARTYLPPLQESEGLNMLQRSSEFAHKEACFALSALSAQR